MLDEADYQQSIADVFEAVEESLSLTKLHSESNNQQMCYQTNKKTQLSQRQCTALHII